MSRLRSTLLTVGAVVGSLGLLLALVGLVGGVKPLVFRSGSMGPEIPAGAMGLARPVDAGDIEVGDVVSVIAANGTRVTHRVVEVSEATGPVRILTLQGDANPVPDSETYPVTRVDRVFWSIPLLGYVVAFFSSSAGLLLLTSYLVAMLVLGFRPRQRSRHRGGRPKARVLVALALAGSVTLAGTGTWTSAAFSDTAIVSSNGLTPLTLASPATASTPCSGGGQVVVRWNGVSPSSGPAADRYEYVVKLYDRDVSPNQLLGTQFYAHSGVAGSTQSVTFSASLLGNLFQLNLLGTERVRVEIQSRLVDSSWPGVSWRGNTLVSVNFTATTVLLITSFSCN